MADLLPYIDFTVLMDKSVGIPVITLKDTSVYPAGVNAGITGVFSVTQPDGIMILGTFSSPDVVYASGNLTSKQIELRLSSNSNFQKGLYQVSYTVKHADYTDTTKSSSFSLYYAPIIQKIQEDVDVFIPRLKVYDESNYVLSNFSSPTVTRAWRGNIEEVGIITGTAAEFDLKYSNEYFDAKYQVTLTSYVTYPVLGAIWASIKDKLVVWKSFKTEVPDSLNKLFVDISTYKSLIKEKCCREDKYNREDYMYAFALFQHLIMKGKCGGTLTLRSDVAEIKKVLNGGVNQVYKQTNSPIQHYSFNDFCGIDCGCEGETVTEPLAFSDHPDAQSVSAGANVTFSGALTGGVTPYIYQWQKKIGGNWVNITGATAATLVVEGVDSDDQTEYRLVGSDSVNNVVYSNAAALTVSVPVLVTYGWNTTDPWLGDTTAPTINNSATVNIANNANISLNFPETAQDTYIIVKVPDSQSLKNSFNNGTNTLVGNTGFPMQELRRYSTGGFTYYVARNPLGFDYTQPLNFTS